MHQEPWANQSAFDVRFEWGANGTKVIAPGATVVVVDVLRFTTAVEAATHGGSAVYPYRWRDESAHDFARSLGAHLADGSDPDGPSLSPSSLRGFGPDDSIVLPSPNGSTCAVLAAEAGANVVAGCLRNAVAIGKFLQRVDGPVSVIACGEQWPDGSLRPALEDYFGAGAVLSEIGGQFSPEARAVREAWRATRGDVSLAIQECVSGKKLSARGRLDDVLYASEVNVSDVVPLLQSGAFRRAA
jgi:2-phosphosulfolactate phosphatase